MGYSELARMLTSRYQLDPPLSRVQVFLWDQRRTLNAAGQVFPSPVVVDTSAPSRRPRRLFDFAAVDRWVRPGIPGPRRKGWRNIWD